MSSLLQALDFPSMHLISQFLNLRRGVFTHSSHASSHVSLSVPIQCSVVCLTNFAGFGRGVLMDHIRKQRSFPLSSLLRVHPGLRGVLLEKRLVKPVDMHSFVHLLLGVSHLLWSAIDIIDLPVTFSNLAVVLSDVEIPLIKIPFPLFMFFAAHSFILQILVRFQSTIQIDLLNLVH